jgi:glyoxylase I family protein
MKPLIKKNIIGVMQYVEDLERASQWYCSNLGFAMGDFDFNDFVELKVDDKYVMHLFKTDKPLAAERATFSFDTDDIEEAHRSLSEREVDVGPIQNYGDHKAFSFKDCDGNRLMISQY